MPDVATRPDGRSSASLDRNDEDSLLGLTAKEAAARLAADGPNELPRANRRSLGRIIADVFREPMFGMLVAAGLLYLLLGDATEAALLLIFALLSIVITAIQETRSERVIDALRSLTAPQALVVRAGSPLRIPGRDVVVGDHLLLSEGDRVPADARLIHAIDLQTDESLLTGESVPVRKRAAAADDEGAPEIGGDDQPHVFSGTLVVRGQGRAVTSATGPRTEIGRIGQSLAAIEAAPVNLRKQTGRIVRAAAILGLICCAGVVLLYGLLRGSWIDALLAGIALGMAMMPEEFPLVLTVFMVMGAWRISKARVLTRHTAAIEALGEATVLCTDKTGTLTENRMTVAALDPGIDPGRGAITPPKDGGLCDDVRHLAETAARASAADAWDPMDRAFRALAPDADAGLMLAKTYGMRPDRFAVVQVWRGTDGLRAAAKGAPEAIATLCRLSSTDRAALLARADRLAASGMRVLAVADAPATDPLPPGPEAFGFSLLGLAALADPLRQTVPGAIAASHKAGIRVVMITGDYMPTAQAIARQAGIEAGAVLDGAAIAAMDDAGLRQAVSQTSVFARIAPAQKLRIVRALKESGEIVAMTGDGVNDAPSLKAADIGIAMGGRGTDVAREASSLVLLDDDFPAIVSTIRLGRRIYDNLRKAMGYIIAVHVPIAGLALLPLLAGLPLVFGPVHIAFLEMVIDPVCSIVFEAEPEESDIMRRPPRAPSAPLLSRALVLWGLAQGIVALLALGGVYVAALRRGLPETDARALTFVSLVLIDLGLVLVNRGFSPSFRRIFTTRNRALSWVAAITGIIMTLVLSVPLTRDLFRLGVLHAHDLAAVAGIVTVVILALEGLKYFWRQRLTA
ncbi:MAG TPA: cation-translocating P-type ATPase [Rhodopila sp.]|nr:cation-translocating P-type ATPase [Rhodopila sp.]